MKKSSIIHAVFVVVAFVTTTGAHAQNTQMASAKSKKALGTMESAPKFAGNLISSKAVKNFHKEFTPPSGETWFYTEGGFVAKFTQDGIETRVDYDKKGNWMHTIRTYDEYKLPEDVRHLVKSSYYDYNITQVQEIEMPRDSFTYIVHLEGKTTLINVKVINGEMEEWEKFDKSK
jgi:hypothetical protein